MLANILGKNYLRQRYLKNTSSSVMKDFYKHPFPEKKQFLDDVSIVSIDFETTGLDFKKDYIVSVGAIDVVNMGIQLDTAYHQLILSNVNLNESSVVIHHITDSALAGGERIEDVFPLVLQRLAGKVLLAHNAKVEMGFLNQLCKQLYNTCFTIPVIDTQFLAKRSFERKNIGYKSSDLRLFNLRDSFNMPAYKAHNALMDAVATAELFLALISQISPKKNARLKEVLC